MKHHWQGAIVACVFTLAASLVGARPAVSQDEVPNQPYLKTLMEFILPDDLAELDTLETDFRVALAEMARRPDLDPATAASVEEMTALLSLERLPIVEDDLAGDWTFLSRQLDDLGAYTYSFFPGRIYPEAQAIILDKSGGSQKHFGMMAQQGADALLYVGALSYNYDARPRLYSTMEAEPDTESRGRDEVGMLYRIGPDRYILIFAPLENRFEILEIVPR